MADEQGMIRRFACAEKVPDTGAGISTTSGYRLPADFVERSVARLVRVSAMYAGFFLVMYILHAVTPLGQSLPRELKVFYGITALLGVGLGLGVAAFTYASKLPGIVKLDIGLGFEIAGALLISLAESRYPLHSAEIIRGHSSIALWLVFFVLLVPTCRVRSVMAAFLTAAMGPLGYWINIRLFDIPAPTFSQAVFLYSGIVLSAAIALPMSRIIYSLGAQVSKARELGSYEMIEVIGRGGMGEVWRARHRMLVRQAAIKLIRPESLFGGGSGQPEAARRRFEREAQAIAGLQSPNTVTLYDYGVNDEGTFYYAMELLDGLDFDSLVQRFGPLPASRVAYLMEQACDSLAEAHARGLTHRDIKPKNIFLCRLGLNYDFVKVLDFGLAKWKDSSADTRLTREGVTTGTPAFMAPELALASDEIDSRTDIYALGCVAYWLLTGKLVFEASTAMAMALAHVQTAPVPPSQRTELEIPRALEDLVMQCLSKAPDSRPQSVREIARHLSLIRTAHRWTSADAEEWWHVHHPSPCCNTQSPQETAADSASAMATAN
ncbi:MAG: serine/threonine protein kinase [Bryobacterales bacterium]|nr:serine/threonine protein kinase [Bryobacterales bacterium]